MDYKYTKDGKKVVVIGQLNNQETIVQEIFVVNGQEVPGGENFVAKGLLDNPGISWKESNLKKIEDTYDRKQREYDQKEEKLRMTERTYLKALSLKVDSLRKMTDAITLDAFEMVSKLLKGEYKYFIDEYSYDIKPFTIEDDASSQDNWSYVHCDGLKLITLFGKSDGDFHFRINRYSDGSGGNSNLYLFTTIEEAKEKLLELINEGNYYHERDIKALKKWGFTLDPEKYGAYKTNRKNNAEKVLLEVQEKLKKAKEELKESLK